MKVPKGLKVVLSDCFDVKLYYDFYFRLFTFAFPKRLDCSVIASAVASNQIQQIPHLDPVYGVRLKKGLILNCDCKELLWYPVIPV